LSRNLGTLTSWNNLGRSRPVTGLLYFRILPTEGIYDVLISERKSDYSFSCIALNYGVLLKKKEGECLLRSTNCNFNYNRLVFVFLGLIFLDFIHHTVSKMGYIMSNKLAMMNKEETKQ